MSNQNNEVKIEDLPKIFEAMSLAITQSKTMKDLKTLHSALKVAATSPEVIQLRENFIANMSNLDNKGPR